MKTRSLQGPAEAAMMLIDMVVYVSMLMLVLGMAFMGFYSVWEHTVRLERNAVDIKRAVQAGEQWRADVRNAQSLPRMAIEAQAKAFHIPQGKGEIVYLFRGTSIFRQAAPGAAPLPFLEEVKESRMLLEQRNDVSSCRWELELQPTRKPGRMKPLFSFQAVPAGQKGAL